MTLRWWNDLWLNEGFASYVEYLGVDYAEPSWNVVSPHRLQELRLSDVQAVTDVSCVLGFRKTTSFCTRCRERSPWMPWPPHTRSPGRRRRSTLLQRSLRCLTPSPTTRSPPDKPTHFWFDFLPCQSSQAGTDMFVFRELQCSGCCRSFSLRVSLL